MMKNLIVLLAIAFTTTTMANERRDSEAKIIKTAANIVRVASGNLRLLTDDELRDLARTLKRAENIILGRRPMPRPVPRPRPIPRPIPVPQIACENDTASVFQATFTKIKDFAYSSDGYNYSSTSARNFAMEWTKEHSCDEADLYISLFKRLKRFSYSSDGLNYSSTSARNFAAERMNSFCSYYDLEGEFKGHFNFAYSSSGLNYSSTSARKYAFDKVEAPAFSCHNF